MVRSTSKRTERRALTHGEEVFNSVTHGVGALLSVAGLVVLVVSSVAKGTVWHVVSSAVFGSSLICLYTFSTVYHSVTNPRIKQVFARLGHVAIFLLIAGTYTPFVLTTLRGPLGWTISAALGVCVADPERQVVARVIRVRESRGATGSGGRSETGDGFRRRVRLQSDHHLSAE